MEPCFFVLSDVNDGPVGTVSWNRTSLLDALFCFEPHRNNGHDL